MLLPLEYARDDYLQRGKLSISLLSHHLINLEKDDLSDGENEAQILLFEQDQEPKVQLDHLPAPCPLQPV